MRNIDIADARKTGFNEEINQTKIETAKKMKKKGIDISDIMDITGLTKEEIEKL